MLKKKLKLVTERKNILSGKDSYSRELDKFSKFLDMILDCLKAGETPKKKIS